MINIFQPSLSTKESEAVSRVMQSNWLGRGAIATEFESAWAHHIGVDPAQCLSITSATEGLFAIFQMLLSPGDEVIIPSIHFVGVANAVRAAGGIPVFCDVDKWTLNTTAQFITDRITDKTRAVCILHYGGYPCAIDEIGEAIRDKGIYLIEDSANSPASTYKGKACGTWGDFAVWSFDAYKIMSTGDGGIVYARNPDDIQTIKKMLYLGQDEMSGYSSTRKRWWETDILMPGRRGLMNDLNACIGIEQLKKLSIFIDVRRKIFGNYQSAFFDYQDWITLPPFSSQEQQSSFYFYWVQLKNEEARDGLAKYLKENGVYVSFRYFPLSRIKLYDHDGYSLPNVDFAADTTLLLPIHQSLSERDVECVVDLVIQYVSMYAS